MSYGLIKFKYEEKLPSRLHLQEIKINKRYNGLDHHLHNELTELIIDVLFLDDNVMVDNLPPSLEYLHIRIYSISNEMFFPVVETETWKNKIKQYIRLPYDCELRIGKLENYLIFSDGNHRVIQKTGF
jgi:hypothetical protein